MARVVKHKTNTDTSYMAGLLSVWNLANNANDSHGVNNGSATLVNYVNGKHGQAAEFATAASIISVPNSASLNTITNASGLSVSLWVRKSAWNLNTNFLFMRPNTGGTSGSYYIGNLSGSFFAATNGAAGLVIAPNYTANQWCHLCMTVGAGVLSFYVNGILVGVDTVIGTLTATTEPLTIGNFNASLSNPDALIDLVCLWNRPLTSEEVAEQYNNTYPFKQKKVLKRNGRILKQ